MDRHPVPQPKPDHRYTDREVALLLQRAAEIEARHPEGSPAHGLTLRELREIANDVGISSDAFEQAVASVQAGLRPSNEALLGAPLSSKAVRGITGRLSAELMERLLRVVEEHMDQTGTVSEALGTVRWTSVARDQRFDSTTQVSLSVQNDETQIQVVQRYPSALRGILHFLPGLWGGAAAVMIAANAGLPAMEIVASGAGAILLGTAIGRGIWQLLARRSAQQVQRIAGVLSTTARELMDERASTDG